MKYVLMLYVCSYLTADMRCFTTHVVPLKFDNYKDCILQGYKSSHNTLKELYSEQIEKDKLAIRFYCQEVIIDEKKFKEENNDEKLGIKS